MLTYCRLLFGFNSHTVFLCTTECFLSIVQSTNVTHNHKYTFRNIVMMTSLNGNIFRVTGHLCGEFTGIPHTKASHAELWCFFYLRVNKGLSKQSGGWWFGTPSWSLWRHSNVQQKSLWDDMSVMKSRITHNSTVCSTSRICITCPLSENRVYRSSPVEFLYKYQAKAGDWP